MIADKMGPSQDEWQHRYFEAEGGTKLALDYRLKMSSTTGRAQSVWLNVSNEKFDGSEQVVAEIDSYGEGFFKQKLDLKFADGRFTGQVTEFEDKPVRSLLRAVRQTIKVTINGSPLKNLENQKEEFECGM